MRPLRPILRWLLAFSGLLVFAVIGITIHLNADPRNTIPRQVLPTPNAFDYDVKAGDALVASDKIQEALGIHRYGASGDPPPYTLSQKETLVRENSAALKFVRAGFSFPYLSPLRAEDDPFLPYRNFRVLAWLFRLEGEVRTAHGDWGGAADSNLDAIRLGADIPHGGAELESGTGINCQSIGRKSLWELVPHLTAKQAKSDALRLDAIQANQMPYAETMQEEEWSGQAGLLKIFQIRNWRQAIVRGASSALIDSVGGRLAILQLQTKLMVTSKQAMYADYTRYMDQYIRIARAPYAAKIPVQPLPLDPYHEFLLSAFPEADYGIMRLPVTRCETENALLTVTLALQAYQMNHRTLPKTLPMLAPEYVHKMPDDPFALSGPLHYRLNGQKVIVYSVGPDGKDDHGAPIYDPTQSAPSKPGAFNRKYWVKDESKGDVVAGINLD